jgi:hypothetical protein
VWRLWRAWLISAVTRAFAGRPLRQSRARLGQGKHCQNSHISAGERGLADTQIRRQGNRNASNVYTLNVQKLRAAAFAHLPDSDTSNPDASKSDASKSDASESDPSKFEASELAKKAVLTRQNLVGIRQ